SGELFDSFWSYRSVESTGTSGLTHGASTGVTNCPSTTTANQVSDKVRQLIDATLTLSHPLIPLVPLSEIPTLVLDLLCALTLQYIHMHLHLVNIGERFKRTNEKSLVRAPFRFI